MSALVPFGTTGNICQKSPPHTIVSPLKGLIELFSYLVFRISLKVLSKASKQNLCAIGASSQIIKEVFIRSPANKVPYRISQVDSAVTSKGI